ncbi:MAG: hypothetical protein H0U74_14810 [Bradymonadaceae bacterium]|nr:hypothetical protein [Lujinxingiaceae bacterium]
MLQRPIHAFHEPSRRLALVGGSRTLYAWKLDDSAGGPAQEEISEPRVGRAPEDTLELRLGGLQGLYYQDATTLVCVHTSGELVAWRFDSNSGKFEREPAWKLDLKIIVCAFALQKNHRSGGWRLAVGSDQGKVIVLDTLGGHKPAFASSPSNSHRDAVIALTFDADGARLASSGRDRDIRVWATPNTDASEFGEADTLSCLYTLKGCDGWPLALAFSHDQYFLAAGCMDNGLYTWELGPTPYLEASSFEHHGWISDVSWAPKDALIATSSWDNSVGLFDARSLAARARFNLHRDYAVKLLFVPNSALLLSASYDQSVAVWNWRENRLVRVLRGHQDWVSDLAFLGDDHVASISTDHSVFIWSLSDWRLVEAVGANLGPDFELGEGTGVTAFDAQPVLGGASFVVQDFQARASTPATGRPSYALLEDALVTAEPALANDAPNDAWLDQWEDSHPNSSPEEDAEPEPEPEFDVAGLVLDAISEPVQEPEPEAEAEPEPEPESPFDSLSVNSLDIMDSVFNMVSMPEIGPAAEPPKPAVEPPEPAALDATVEFSVRDILAREALATPLSLSSEVAKSFTDLLPDEDELEQAFSEVSSAELDPEPDNGKPSRAPAFKAHATEENSFRPPGNFFPEDQQNGLKVGSSPGQTFTGLATDLELDEERPRSLESPTSPFALREDAPTKRQRITPDAMSTSSVPAPPAKSARPPAPQASIRTTASLSAMLKAKREARETADDPTENVAADVVAQAIAEASPATNATPADLEPAARLPGFFAEDNDNPKTLTDVALATGNAYEIGGKATDEGFAVDNAFDVGVLASEAPSESFFGRADSQASRLEPGRAPLLSDDLSVPELVRPFGSRLEEPSVVETTIDEVFGHGFASAPGMGIMKRRLPAHSEYQPLLHIRTAHDSSARVALAPVEKKLITCGLDEEVCIWQTVGDLERSFRLNESGAGGVGFVADGNIAYALGNDHDAHFWLLPKTALGRSGRVRHTTLKGHRGPITSASAHQGGKYFMTGSRDGTARIWDLNDGSHVTTLDCRGAAIVDVTFGLKGPVTASEDGSVRLWDARGLQIDQIDVSGKLLSIDGRAGWLCWTATSGAVHAIEEGGNKPRQLWGHHGEARSVCFRGDGCFATAGEDGRVLLYSPGEEKPFQEIQLPAPATWVSFTEKLLAVACEGGAVYLFRRSFN